ncbi:unnamed protein product [Paramecium sonneborni]|uniref:Transmembrane protein n=1 Tax=Paramecium sonneborni TaxID=65129 RepID=A0A8S1QYW3_9CILI|nr:unnamed protein product [Paramecium sonneborni]
MLQMRQHQIRHSTILFIWIPFEQHTLYQSLFFASKTTKFRYSKPNFSSGEEVNQIGACYKFQHYQQIDKINSILFYMLFDILIHILTVILSCSRIRVSNNTQQIWCGIFVIQKNYK